MKDGSWVTLVTDNIIVIVLTTRLEKVGFRISRIAKTLIAINTGGIL